MDIHQAIDFVIDNFEGGWYHPAMGPTIYSRTGVSMDSSGYTMFGLDDPAGGEAISRMMRRAFDKYGGYDKYKDIKFWNDKADGRKSMPKELGDELRKESYNYFGPRAASLAGLDIDDYDVLPDDVAIICVYAHYTGVILPQRILNTTGQLIKANRSEEIQDAIRFDAAMYWNQRWVNALLKKAGLTVNLSSRPDAVAYMKTQYFCTRLTDSTRWSEIHRLLGLSPNEISLGGHYFVPKGMRDFRWGCGLSAPSYLHSDARYLSVLNAIVERNSGVSAPIGHTVASQQETSRAQSDFAQINTERRAQFGAITRKVLEPYYLRILQSPFNDFSHE